MIKLLLFLNRKPIKLLIKIVLSIICFYMIYQWLKPQNFFNPFRDLKIDFFLFAVLVNLLHFLLNAAKLRLLFPSPFPSLNKMLAGNFIAAFFQTFLPGGIGGDVVRWKYISDNHRKDSKSEALIAVMLDRITGLWAHIFIALFAGLWLYRENPAIAIFACLGLAIICGTLILSIYGFRFIFKGIQILVNVYTSWQKQPKLNFDQKGEALLDLFNSKNRFVKVIAIGLFSQLLVVLALVLLDRALEGDLNWAQATWVLFGYTLVQTIPITLGNLGVAEATLGLLYQNMGSTSGIGVLISLLVRLMNIFPALIGWVLFLTHRAERSQS